MASSCLSDHQGLNSSKSNRLPEWDLYFGNLAALKYKMYETVFSHEQI